MMSDMISSCKQPSAPQFNSKLQDSFLLRSAMSWGALACVCADGEMNINSVESSREALAVLVQKEK